MLSALERGRQPGTGEVITIAAAPNWWLITGAPGTWRRRPLACFALVEDGGSPFVAGMTVPEGELIEVAEPGTYLHDTEFVACRCDAPVTGDVDASWCRACAGTLR